MSIYYTRHYRGSLTDPLVLTKFLEGKFYPEHTDRNWGSSKLKNWSKGTELIHSSQDSNSNPLNPEIFAKGSAEHLDTGRRNPFSWQLFPRLNFILLLYPTAHKDFRKS